MKNNFEMKGISKSFPGVKALEDVSITLCSGEVHGLLGENGAGKSTLIKCLTGVHQPDEGEMFMNGTPMKFNNPSMAIDQGISCVYQELNVLPDISVTDNIFVGNYKQRALGFVDYKAMHTESRRLLQLLKQDIDPKMMMGNLGVGQQQMVEIAKALSRDAKILVLDEPTASLSGQEIKELMDVIRYLRKQGVAILFISHKLEEVFEICDMVTILRDGKHIITEKTSKMTNESLIANMVGRELDDLVPKVVAPVGDEMLRVENLSRYGNYKDISFHVKAGEVLGFSGLVGAGRTEVLRGVFGLDEIDEGQVYIKNEKVSIKSPQDAIEHKLAFVTEDRKGEGLIEMHSVTNNLALVNLKEMSKSGFLNKIAINEMADNNISELKIKIASKKDPVGELSGGNQQKVVIGKWLNAEADIYIFDEPTRGIDVGAKVEVYNLMNELTKAGKAIIMISSELPEILGMSDRVIVLRGGQIMGEINRNHKDFNEETIMKAAWGGKI